MSPSLWVLANVAPHHAKECLSMYGLGLGVSSTEPREQKHQQIRKFSENTTPQNKWEMIARHEYVSTIYLRQNGFDRLKYYPRKHRYIPEPSESSCPSCGLVLKNDICDLCNSSAFDIVKTFLEDDST